ncbi:hypothetical protein [Deefgea salmonis]|uniref:Uncharacterized protein n=1 Tax=Deefgea salmonis TaxID=2875502 RepID=A0ABS8BLK6_9NEIS|nr:hypothetical protein [Deefgea salmonis]MCB5196607.1 hypothetical protein [Deefgea salmonis]
MEEVQNEPSNWHVILRPNHERKVLAKSKMYRLRNNQPERLDVLEEIVGNSQFKYNRFARVIDSPEQYLVDRLRAECIEKIGHDRDIIHYLIAIAIERSELSKRR